VSDHPGESKAVHCRHDCVQIEPADSVRPSREQEINGAGSGAMRTGRPVEANQSIASALKTRHRERPTTSRDVEGVCFPRLREGGSDRHLRSNASPRRGIEPGP
jgi:hypothetical protein